MKEHNKEKETTGGKITKRKTGKQNGEKGKTVGKG